MFWHHVSYESRGSGTEPTAFHFTTSSGATCTRQLHGKSPDFPTCCSGEYPHKCWLHVRGTDMRVQPKRERDTTCATLRGLDDAWPLLLKWGHRWYVVWIHLLSASSRCGVTSANLHRVWPLQGLQRLLWWWQMRSLLQLHLLVVAIAPLVHWTRLWLTGKSWECRNATKLHTDLTSCLR